MSTVWYGESPESQDIPGTRTEQPEVTPKALAEHLLNVFIVEDSTTALLGTNDMKKYQEQLSDTLVTLNVPDLCDLIRESVNKYIDHDFNIAVCGRNGTGKTSLINRIINLYGRNEQTDGLGHHARQDEELDPAQRKIVFWDAPKLATNDSDKEFCGRTELSNFDAFVILSSHRLSQEDISIASEALKQEIPFYMVTSKLDIEMDNIMQNYGHDKETALATIRKRAEDTVRHRLTGHRELLPEPSPRNNMYLVSATSRFHIMSDLQMLINSLIEDTSLNEINEMLQIMKSCCVDIIFKKKTKFMARISVIASEAFRPGSSYRSVVSEVDSYVEHFGVSSGDVYDRIQLDKLDEKIQAMRSSLTREKRRVRKSQTFKRPINEQQETDDIIKEIVCRNLQKALDQCELLSLNALEDRCNILKIMTLVHKQRI